MIPTRVSRALRRDHRFFGKSAYQEISGREPLVSQLTVALTGRWPTPAERAMLDDLAAAVSVADPRIWPLKVARLVASHGSTLAGWAAGVLVLDSDVIGPMVTEPAAHLLASLVAEPGRWRTLPARVPGFGVPAREVDERVLHMLEVAERHGRVGPHVRALRRLSELLTSKSRIGPNAAAGMAAVLLDLGFRPEHTGTMSIVLMHHAIVANAAEGAQQRAVEALALPPTAVRYVGEPGRVSPRARRASSRRSRTKGRSLA